ncbi:glycosyl hydrolase 108 family protein [Agrobacterium vitis]|uniref:glycoside hydrolase family 108 protein n=1 Tax=Agrobacterium vitis TaxID=373 RepID=UPI0012E8A2A5|nr:glycosyl hydrolase 108 family protein [Agrobacterium vitis]MVA23225.1 N-acetylmuramidase [Agrobacterium vitis]
MADEFKRSVAQVLGSEGGYSNRSKKDDPGGATNLGVTQAVYDVYRRSIGAKPQSVKFLVRAEAENIYRGRYWALVKADQLPAGVSYVVFDGAVNSGPAQSAKWLQRALGVPDDGLVGPATIAAAKAHTNHDALIANMIRQRLAFMKTLSNWEANKNGWANRLKHVLDVGQAWASGDVGPAPVYHENGDAKAPVSAVKAAPSSAPGEAATAVGGASAVLAQTTQQLAPFSNIELVGKIIAFLTVAGALVAIGGIAYSIYAKRKAKAVDVAVNGAAT